METAVRARVLIAEDDAELRDSLRDILELHGNTVTEAEDGERALALLADNPPDVLLLDLHMPRLDGVSLLRRVEVPPPIVIVYSAFELYSPDEVRRTLGAKVFRALQKPVPPAQLVAAITDGLEELRRRTV